VDKDNAQPAESANRSANTEPQLREAASPQGLRSGYLQR